MLSIVINNIQRCSNVYKELICYSCFPVFSQASLTVHTLMETLYTTLIGKEQKQPKLYISMHGN